VRIKAKGTDVTLTVESRQGASSSPKTVNEWVHSGYITESMADPLQSSYLPSCTL